MSHVDLAYSTEHLLTGRIALAPETHPDSATIVPFYERLHRELNRLPGVVNAWLTSSLPLTGSSRVRYATGGKNFDDERSYPVTRLASVSPTFFETLGVEPAVGRTLEEQDDTDRERVVIVNQTFANREWPGQYAIGQKIRLLRGEEKPWLTVVGVVPDLNQGGLADPLPQTLYVPMAQQPMRFMSAMIKTSGDPNQLVPAIRESLASLDATVPFYQIQTVDQLLDQTTFFNRLVASIFSILTLAALILAATGMYSVLAFSVSRRQAEVGVRMALGAARQDIHRLIIGQGLHQVIRGLIFGLILSAGLARLLSSQLFGIDAWDPLTFASMAGLLLVIGWLASWIPAERASRVKPIKALRCD